MILRVFWPCSLASDHWNCDHQAACLLLGAFLDSIQKSQPVLSVVVVDAVPLAQLPATEAVEQQLANSKVTLLTGSAQATLAVLGVWQPEKEQHLAPTSSAWKHPASTHELWLVLRGKQRLQETVGSNDSWCAQQLQAPRLELQQSTLPPGTKSVQVNTRCQLVTSARSHFNTSGANWQMQ